MIIDNIIINKESNVKGTAFVRLYVEEGSEDFYMTLNHIEINLVDSINPISSYKINSTQIIGGPIINDIFEAIKDIFVDGLEESPPGLYKITADEIKQLNTKNFEEEEDNNE